MRYYPTTKREAKETMKRINPRRGELIDKKVHGGISDAERRELKFLQAYADWCVYLVAGSRMELVREGK